MRGGRLIGLAVLWFVVAGCGRNGGPATVDKSESTLKIGYGLTAGARREFAAQLMTQEGLVNLYADGRPVPWLATRWAYTPDGLGLSLWLQPNASFHDGTAVTSEIVRQALVQQLPDVLGRAYENIADIKAVASDELLFVLKRRSTLLLEALNLPIHAPNSNAGTGPFYDGGHRGDAIDLLAFEKYYGGPPSIDRIVIDSSKSVRSAWADMLRGQLDMVYELPVDAFDLTRTASGTKVFTFQRPYPYAVILNVKKPALRDASVRRALNDAINRDELVSRILEGHGRVIDGPISPQHWVKPDPLPHFRYQPNTSTLQKLAFRCMYSDPTFERIAIFVQQQLQAVGVDMQIDPVPVDPAMERVEAGDFDAWLVDVGMGPSFFRQNLFWHSGSPLNWGQYSSAKVDAALDAINASRNDDEYKAGAASFQQAMIDDPPAIFLAWSDRTRAVSTRFDVHEEPGRDIISTLRLWRPSGVANMTHN
jgi:peptide/nickel transport system substrate-binding protein